MKKVELITLQDVPNYGSVLQAYATQKTFEKLGYECEIIKYTPERMTKLGMLKNIKHKSEKFEKSLLWRTAARIVIFPSYIKRFGMFKKFRKKYLNETSKTYRTNEEIKVANLKADIYCTGSDQVWNSGWNGGIDKAMFLDFAPKNAKCITYAASFGKSELDNNEIKQTKKLLEKYESISVRESSAVDILKDLGIKSTNVVDPTLLLSGEEWRELSSNKFKNEKYILVYNLNRNNKIDEYAQMVAKKKGLKVKYISYQLHEKYKKGKVYCSPSIEDFIALIDNAQLVVSDSFHATAFSVNLNTDFAIVLPNKYSTRLNSFLMQLGLKDRVIKKDELLSPINFEPINLKLEKMRVASEKWINGATSEKNSRAKMPLISVIVPVYNNEKYVEKCINSICEQSYKNIEIIIVDDGSTNETTPQILEKLAKTDKRIKVIKQKNAGVSMARNKGLDNASGEYVVFVDSDDFVASDYIEYLYKLISSHNADFAYTPSIFRSKKEEQVQKDEVKIIDSDESTALLLSPDVVVGSWNKIYRRKIIESNKLRFRRDLYYGEGLNFILRMSKISNKIAIGKRKVYYYRKNNMSSATTAYSCSKFQNGYSSILMSNEIIDRDKKEVDDMYRLHLCTFCVNAVVAIKSSNGKHKSIDELKRWKRIIKENKKKVLSSKKVTIYRKTLIIAGYHLPKLLSIADRYRRKRIINLSID